MVKYSNACQRLPHCTGVFKYSEVSHLSCIQQRYIEIDTMSLQARIYGTTTMKRNTLNILATHARRMWIFRVINLGRLINDEN